MLSGKDLAVHATALLIAGKIPTLGVTSRPGMGTKFKLIEAINEFGGTVADFDASFFQANPDLLKALIGEQSEKFDSENRILIIDVLAIVTYYGALPEPLYAVLLDAVRDHKGILVYGPSDIPGIPQLHNRMINVAV